MIISGPRQHNNSTAGACHGFGRGLLLALALLVAAPLFAQDTLQLESIGVQTLPGQRIELRLELNGPAPDPQSFTINDPATIAIDLPNTELALDSRRQDINLGAVQTVLAAEGNGRTRVVLNLNAMTQYTTRVEGNSVVIEVGGSSAPQPTFAAQPQPGAAAGARRERAVSMIDFRRGPDGAGQVVVELTDPATTVDVREEGGRIIVEFSDTSLPDELLRRLDVSDFATPVATVDALRDNQDTRLVVTPSSDYEQIAYQADNRFTLELKTPIVADSSQQVNIFGEDREYVGERLGFDFLDIETRAVLQLLAQVSGLNIVVSDSVTGSVTLRLQDVPWDQALDLVMTTKALDMRRNGNVILVAPAAEIAAREQQALQAMQSRRALEPLRTELIQVNYAKAAEIASLIRGSSDGASLLSQRGSVEFDERTNQLIVQDTSEVLQELRRFVQNLDIPVRQVLVESRIVIVNDDYGRELGVRFGTTIARENSSNGMISLTGTQAGSDTIIDSALDNLANTGQPFPVSIGSAAERYNVDLPLANPAGVINLAVLDSDFLIDLELSALQSEGKGEIFSSPRVITLNNREASIVQGVQIPYQQATSSGATSVSFQDATLSLTVTPQITPDDRIIMDIFVTKDSVGEVVPSGFGGLIPSIDTRSVQNQVLVNDGQTVVLGGIYETETRDTVTKVPVLGDIPGLGYLFRTKSRVQNKAELLIFVTPRIIPDNGIIPE